METFYQVVYKKSGNEVKQTRQYVHQAYLIYKELNEKASQHPSLGITDLRLEEVSANGIAVLRGKVDEVKTEPTEEVKKVEVKVKQRPRSIIELLTGVSEEEYMECVSDFARLHGATLKDWGLED